MGTTLAAIQSGHIVPRFVVIIDGYPHPLSDAPQAAVQTAWAGTDFAGATVIGGLLVDLDIQQQLDPWNTFMGGGRCTLTVIPDDDDIFGIDTHRTDAGAETLLQETANRTVDLNVFFVDGFPFNGEAYIGTECFGYSLLAAHHFGSGGGVPGARRGKYVAAGVKDSTTTYGSVRFAEHHRVTFQDDGVRLAPVISAQPRSWKGRRVSIWMHTWDESTSSLNTKDEALCVFLGELTETRDDAATGATVMLVESELDRIKKYTLGRDFWVGTLSYGHHLAAGLTFKFQDSNGTTVKNANDLVVVSSGANDANHIDAGWYSIEEICSLFNKWLANEYANDRINGTYTINSPEDSGGQPRTVVRSYIAGSGNCYWRFQWPTVSWASIFGLPSGLYWTIHVAPNTVTPTPNNGGSPNPGGMFFNDPSQPSTLYAMLGSQTGLFQGQYASLPPSIKAGLPAGGGQWGNNWGLFVLEGETPLIFSAAIETVGGVTALRHIQGRNNAYGLALNVYGDLLNLAPPFGGDPPKIRQIFVHAAPAKTLLKWLFYSTGTTGYNHPTYDVLPYGQGLNIPYDYLGSYFESSCDLLPGADDLIALTIDKPTKLAELLGNDLLVRTAHLIWRQGGLRFISWTTPSSAGTITPLGESSKSAPAGTKDSQITASVLDGSWIRNQIKINYNRDVLKSVSSGDAIYNSPPITLEDATSIDDNGPALITIDLKNVYGESSAISPGIHALAKNMYTWLPWFSRAIWKVTRSLALIYFEGFGVSDTVAVSDPFVRDPTTGRRRITARPGMVFRHRWKIRTSSPPNPVSFQGECDVLFLNVDRTLAYAPAADIDETENSGSFRAGYDGNVTLKFKPHAHSDSGATVDIGAFTQNDVVRLVEVDPADPANPDTWVVTLQSVDVANNQATIDSPLSSPAFSTSKLYRMTFASYLDTQSSQHTKSFQASAETRTIQETVPPNQYGSTLYFYPWNGHGAPTEYDHTTLPELPAQVSYGPNAGAARDTGYDQELCFLLDNLMDHKTALSSPSLALSSRHRTNNASTGDEFKLLDVSMIHLGDMLHGGSVNRWIYIAPRWRSVGVVGDPILVTLRITISGYPPTGSSLSSVTIKAPAAGNTWTCMSSETTMRNDSERGFPVGNFNGHQFVYVIVEGTRTASFLNHHTLRMGERVAQ